MLANRFAPAVKELYPNLPLHLYVNTDSNDIQPKLLTTLWPNNYEKDYTHVIRKSQNYQIKSNFGVETYNASLGNLRDEDLIELNKCEFFFNGHIDSIAFKDSLSNFRNYFHSFPPPQVNLEQFVNKTKGENFKNKNYLLAHLYSRPNSAHILEKWWVEKFIKEIESKLPADHYLYIYCEEKYFDYYSSVISDKVKIFDCSMEEFFYVSKYCKLFFGIDSSPRYVPKHFGKPSYLFSKYCSAPGVVAPSHLLRWIINSDTTIPTHYDIKETARIIMNNLVNSAYSFFPQIKENIENYIVERTIIL